MPPQNVQVDELFEDQLRIQAYYVMWLAEAAPLPLLMLAMGGAQ